MAVHHSSKIIFMPLWLIGFFSGILVGLSASPVAQSLISAVFGIVAALTAVLAGLPISSETASSSISDALKQTHPSRALFKVSPIPLLWLLFGLVFGTGGGFGYEHTITLESPLSQKVAAYQGAGMSKDQAFSVILQYNASIDDPSLGVLRSFTLDTNDRIKLKGTVGQGFIDALGKCQSPELRRLSLSLTSGHSGKWSSSDVKMLESIRDFILNTGVLNEHNL